MNAKDILMQDVLAPDVGPNLGANDHYHTLTNVTQVNKATSRQTTTMRDRYRNQDIEAPPRFVIPMTWVWRAAAVVLAVLLVLILFVPGWVVAAGWAFTVREIAPDVLYEISVLATRMKP